MIILGTNSIKDTGGFNVANSVRMNRGSSDYFRRTNNTAGTSDKIGTYSGWVKRSTTTLDGMFFEGKDLAASNYTQIYFQGSGALTIYSSGGMDLVTTSLYRDPSAWYHVCVAFDTTQGTAANRVKLYVNGTQVTSFATETYPSQNSTIYFGVNGDQQAIGIREDGALLWNGYMAEICYVDGQALAQTDFGEFDEDSGIWKPKNVSGLTFGNNGCYLDFQDASNLGNVVAGNSTDFTENGLTAIDQSTDTCTNNFATMNPLDNYYASSTFAEGNLKITTNASNQTFNTGTIGLSTGKWYWEAKLVQAGGEEAIGITDIVSTGTGIYGGKTANNYSFKGNNGDIRNNDSNSSYGSAYAQGSIISVFMDLDNNKLYFAIDGTLQNSGTGHSITAPASTTNGVYFPMVGDVDTDSVIWECNFGSPSFAISSGNTDGEYGNFEFSTTITGDGASKTFKAINTKNLAEYG
jgi:hypothetical protein